MRPISFEPVQGFGTFLPDRLQYPHPLPPVTISLSPPWQFETRSVFKDAGQLAYEIADIPKPDLIDLMNLFIGWGISIRKRKWLDRMGYK